MTRPPLGKKRPPPYWAVAFRVLVGSGTRLVGSEIRLVGSGTRLVGSGIQEARRNDGQRMRNDCSHGCRVDMTPV